MANIDPQVRAPCGRAVTDRGIREFSRIIRVFTMRSSRWASSSACTLTKWLDFVWQIVRLKRCKAG